MSEHQTSDYDAVLRHTSLKGYLIGFIASLILTLAAYFLVAHHILAGNSLVAAITVLAVSQLIVQLLFFLHLGRESKPRWNLVFFGFMFLIVGILVIGSLWIMNNLNYNTMSPQATDTYIIKDEGIQK
jgi:cytochrome o ubiquinol oxidase operon protein cyoD